MIYHPIYLAAPLTMAEKFSLSGEMLLRGMGTVFLVLCILWGVIAIFGAVGASRNQKKAEEPAPVKTPEPETEPEQESEPDDDGALIAAITAAIEAYRFEEGFTGGYRVVSFKRKSGRKSWNGPAED